MRSLRPAGTAAALVAAIVFAAPAAAAGDRLPPAVEAKAAIAVQAETGAIVYARDAAARRPIASATKLMTALLALERLNLTDVVETAPYRATAGESVAGLGAGERMTVADLLRALLLPSANDAAESLAVAVAGNRKRFVDEMNRRAGQLGLRDTHYENPVGLDGRDNYSSAADLVALTLELRRFPFFVRTTDRERATLASGAHPRIVNNRNRLLRTDPVVDGVKTGYTSRAGYVLVGAARRDGVTIISVVLGAPDERARDESSRALLLYGLDSYERAVPVVARRSVGSVKVKDQGDDRVELIATSSLDRVVRRGARRSLRTVVTAPDSVSGPLPAGTRLGTVELRDGRRTIGRTALVTAAAVPRASFLERTRAVLGRTWTVIVILVVVTCSLTVVAVRRHDAHRRGAEGARAQ